MSRYAIAINSLWAATTDPAATIEVGTTFVHSLRQAMTWEGSEVAIRQALQIAKEFPGREITVVNIETVAKVLNVTFWKERT